MNKKELRKAFKSKRNSLSPQEVERSSQHIAANFTAFLDQLEKKVQYLHLFLPIEKNKEVNTWRIIEQLREKEPHLNIVVSKSNFQDGTMSSLLLKPETKLHLNKLNIPEPVDAEPVEEDDLDLVVMPLLAFDEQGDRVGYGAGFYDKFLADCPDDVLKVGVSFFEAIPRIEDVGDHDIVLDFCVTPQKIYDFTTPS